MFVNTTPHALRLKTQSGHIVEIPPSPDKDLCQVFRGKAVAAKTPPLAFEHEFIATSGPPTYQIDPDEFTRLVQPEQDTIYLVSSISGEALARQTQLRHPRARFFVPYSGPDPARCLRVNGEIQWCAELMEYASL
jgi:hypothetical protein